MTILFSEDLPSVDWSEARRNGPVFGVKGATSLALPRAWTPPFAVISVDLINSVSTNTSLSILLDKTELSRISNLGGKDCKIMVRSSVVGESIWERGSYLSVIIDTSQDGFARRLDQAVLQVVTSAPPKKSGLMIQKFISPASQGEFGNLQRISKTRDQWEISATNRAGSTTNLRLNSQRDAAADPSLPIFPKSGISQERLFGPIAAWLNNELLRGKSQRLTCEWLTDNHRFYLVQIDEEDEDI